MKRVILGCLILLLTAGCVDYSEELWLNKDGSGRARMVIGVLTAYENREEINRYLDQPGISLISKSVYRKDKYTYYSLHFRFNSLEAFNNLNDQVTNADFFGRISIAKDKDGTITMHRKISLGSLSGDEDEIEKIMQSFTESNLKWRYRMHLPWKIVKTNAAPENVDLKTNTVAWEYQVSYLWNKSQTMTVVMKQSMSAAVVILVVVAALVVIASLIWLRRFRSGKSNSDRKVSEG